MNMKPLTNTYLYDETTTVSWCGETTSGAVTVGEVIQQLELLPKHAIVQGLSEPDDDYGVEPTYIDVRLVRPATKEELEAERADRLKWYEACRPQRYQAYLKLKKEFEDEPDKVV